jgi:glycerol uptake facilitator-like aquaporin
LALAGEVSGGYFNSIITMAAMANKKHRIPQVYLPAQLLGGLLGATWCWLITGKMVAGYDYKENEPTKEMIKYIINELVGSFLFSICVLTLTNKFTTHAYKSWQIYISIAATLYLIRKYLLNKQE